MKRALKLVFISITLVLVIIFVVHILIFENNSILEYNHNHSRKLLNELNHYIKPYNENSEWYHIKIPNKSYFGFDSNFNLKKWELAKIQAHNGEHILLQHILNHFPSHLNFLDGDTLFRSYHDIVDVFIDRNKGLEPLTMNRTMIRNKQNKNNKLTNIKIKKYPWELKGYDVLPKDYAMLPRLKRAIIVKVGYYAYKNTKNVQMFRGTTLGKALLNRDGLLTYWNTSKDSIIKPFIILDTHDENWGLFSTHFPNRTAKWGNCCNNEKKDILINEFLNHNKTVMVLINQHSNISHPKIISLPRGLPQHTHRNRIIWDTMRRMINLKIPKNKLLYTAITASVSRPQIISCLSSKFDPNNSFDSIEFKIISKENKKYEAEKRATLGDIAYRMEYYNTLALTRIGFAVPGYYIDSI